MKDVIDVLKLRRSIRAYTSDPVDRKVLEDIVDFARLAATAMNEQPWEFVVVTDQALLHTLPKIMGHAEFIATAAACIVVLCRPTTHYLEDGCAASEHILLAAHAYGLGSCWVAGEKEPYADEILKVVGAPNGYRLICVIALGFPAESPRVDKRSREEVLHWEKF